MSETPRSEQSNENQGQQKIEKPSQQPPEEALKIRERFEEAMKIEGMKEGEIRKQRGELLKKYGDVPGEDMEAVLHSDENQAALESMSKEILDWREKRKDNPIYKAIVKIKSWFKK